MRFGRGGGTPNPGRHRGTGVEQQGADLAPDEELESYLDAISPARDPEVADPGRRFGSAHVYQVRLPAGAEEKLEWLADRSRTAPLAMIQEWVLERLDAEFSAPPTQR